jgi:hypothetical protein
MFLPKSPATERLCLPENNFISKGTLLLCVYNLRHPERPMVIPDLSSVILSSSEESHTPGTGILRCRSE